MVLYCGLKLQHVLCAVFVWRKKKLILDQIGYRKFIKYGVFKQKLKEVLTVYFYGLGLSNAEQRKNTRDGRDLS